MFLKRLIIGTSTKDTIDKTGQKYVHIDVPTKLLHPKSVNSHFRIR